MEERILRDRAREAKTSVLRQAVQADARASLASSWLSQSEAKQQAAAAQRQRQAEQENGTQKLQEHRAALASKLGAEAMALQVEAAARVPTAEEKREALAAKARKLAEKHEAERLQRVQALQDQRIAEDCELLRQVQSKVISERTGAERRQQLEDKYAARLAAMEAQREEDAAVVNSLIEKAEQREAADKASEAARRADTLATLAEQLQLSEVHKAEEERAHCEEVALLKARWAAEAEKEAAARAVAAQRKRETLAEVQRFNRERLQALLDARIAEEAEDRALLEAEVAVQALEEEREAAVRDRQRQEEELYRRHLMEMLQREAEDESARDAMLQAATDAMDAERAAADAAYAEARQRLMREVLDARKQQVEAHVRSRTEEQQEKLAWQAHLEAQAAAYERELREAADKEAAAVEAQKRLLDEQVQEKRAREVAERAAAAAERDNKAVQERQYAAKVQEMVATKGPRTYFGRRKVVWD